MTSKQIKWVTAGLLLASVIAGLDATIINTALPAIISDLNGIEYMAWIIAVFLLGMAVFTPLWSKLGENWGNKKAFQLSVVLFLAGSLLEGLAPNIGFFIAARTLMGIGAGGMGALPYIIIGYVFENINKRAHILGLISASFSAGSIIGPLLGGWIVDTLSWNWIFYINVPLGLVTISLIQVAYKEEVRQTKQAFDYRGAWLMVLGLVAFLLGIQLLGMVSWYYCAGLVLVGSLLIWRLFKVEAKQQTPLIPGHLFKNKALVVDFILFGIAWGASIAFNTYVPMWAQGLLAATALVGGLTQVPGALTDFLGANLAPTFQRKFRDLTVVNLGLIGIMVSVLGLYFLDAKAAYGWLLFLSAFYGFGVGLVFVVLQIRVQQDVDIKDMPAATSLSYLLRILAQTLMAAVYGVLLNFELARGVAQTKGKISLEMMNKLSNPVTNKELPLNLIPQMQLILHQGLHTIMLTATGLLLVGLAFSLWAQKKVFKN